MKKSGSNVEGQKNQAAARRGGSGAGGKLPSLKMIAGCLLMVALVMALGMTGGQVRQLSERMTALEGERDEFHRRLVSLREDNMGLLARLRDYQGVLEVAQSSNVSLSKRVANRELAVSDLQDTLDSILIEKYATEKAMRGDIAALENQKRDLGAQVTALGEAVSAQAEEIGDLEVSYRGAERKLAAAENDSGRLLAENDRYLSMMSELQDSLESAQTSNRELAMNFDELRARSEVVREEKMAIERELEAVRSGVYAPSPAPARSDPFGGEDPFGFDSSIPADEIENAPEVIAEAKPKAV